MENTEKNNQKRFKDFGLVRNGVFFTPSTG
jgi:hypothetical protein